MVLVTHMRYKIKIIVVLLFLALVAGFLYYSITLFSVPKSETTYNVAQPVVSGLDSEKLWDIIQRWRVKNNLKAYIKNENICKIASKRAVELKTDYSHDKFQQIEYPSTLSENANYNSQSEQSTLTSWLSSPPHRKALESNYTYSCVATNGIYAVQIFSNCEYGCP